MKKHHLLLALCILFLVTVWLYILFRKAAPYNIFLKETQLSATVKPAALNHLLASFEQETQRRINVSKAAITEKIQKIDGDLDAEAQQLLYNAAKVLAPTFSALYEQRDYFDKDVIYKEIFEELSRDPLYLTAASRALSDPRFLYEAFGVENQAITRVYAIKFLQYQAEVKGEDQPLKTATRQLFAFLCQEGEQIKGQYYDMEALLTKHLQFAYDTETLLKRGREIVRELFLAETEETRGAADLLLKNTIRNAFAMVTLGRASDTSIRSMDEEIEDILSSDS